MYITKEKSLTPEIASVLLNKGTELPFSGKLTNVDSPGSYLCRLCGTLLFRSEHKFHSSCGWPSFDNEFEHSVKQLPDTDGRRTEIVCNRCEAHLGHVFSGEGYTQKNLRYCVNSVCLDFVDNLLVQDTQEGIFACGCFWGVEFYLKKLKGVLKTEVGYTGGHLLNPTYKDVCHKNTGHLEAIRVLFNPNEVSYESLCRYFFEIHDFSQTNGQGPDLGPQYLSAIYIYNEEQSTIAIQTIKTLMSKNFSVATKILPVSIFWPAEDYHQDYYEKNQSSPYCHTHKKIF